MKTWAAERPREEICICPSSQCLRVCVSAGHSQRSSLQTLKQSSYPQRAEIRTLYTYTGHPMNKYDQHMPNIPEHTEEASTWALVERAHHRIGEMNPSPQAAHHQCDFNKSNPDTTDPPNQSSSGTSSYRVEPETTPAPAIHSAHLLLRTCCLTGAWSRPSLSLLTDGMNLGTR